MLDSHPLVATTVVPFREQVLSIPLDYCYLDELCSPLSLRTLMPDELSPGYRLADMASLHKSSFPQH